MVGKIKLSTALSKGVTIYAKQSLFLVEERGFVDDLLRTQRFQVQSEIDFTRVKDTQTGHMVTFRPENRSDYQEYF